jgi:hypothetical protein
VGQRYGDGSIDFCTDWTPYINGWAPFDCILGCPRAGTVGISYLVHLLSENYIGQLLHNMCECESLSSAYCGPSLVSVFTSYTNATSNAILAT